MSEFRMVLYPGRCSECKRTRPVGPASRYAGGNYRRPSRWYSTSVCGDCAREALAARDRTTADGRVPGDAWMAVPYRDWEKIAAASVAADATIDGDAR